MQKKKSIVSMCINVFQAKNIGTPTGKGNYRISYFWGVNLSLRCVSLSQGARKVRAADTAAVLIPYIFVSV